MLQAFSDAYRRWPSGTFLMWYPIRSASQRSNGACALRSLRISKMLFADLAIHPDDAGVGLAGSGLMIVNPPYGADEYLQQRLLQPFTRRSRLRGAGYVGSGAPDARTNGTMTHFLEDLNHGFRRACAISSPNCMRNSASVRRRGSALESTAGRGAAGHPAAAGAAARARRSSAPPGPPRRSLPERLEKIAVQFEVDHPTLAASSRRLIDLSVRSGL